MDKVDQFESVFRSATRERFQYERRIVRSVMIVTDRAGDEAQAFAAQVRNLTGSMAGAEEVTTVLIEGDRFQSPQDLLELMEAQRPDVVATHRCLHSQAWRWVFTLGAHVDVLTQATTTPVLLLPHPEHATGEEWSPGTTDRIMAITDHLDGEASLINAALSCLHPGGTLFLSHVEDDAVFERYIDVVSRIPEIDTELAREKLRALLLKEPADYIRSAGAAIAEAGVEARVQAVISMGHRVAEYRTLIEAHGIDLLVLNTKDEDHSAMHGLAYPLAVELRDLPLLLL